MLSGATTPCPTFSGPSKNAVCMRWQCFPALQMGKIPYAHWCVCTFFFSPPFSWKAGVGSGSRKRMWIFVFEILYGSLLPNSWKTVKMNLVISVAYAFKPEPDEVAAASSCVCSSWQGPFYLPELKSASLQMVSWKKQVLPFPFSSTSLVNSDWSS